MKEMYKEPELELVCVLNDVIRTSTNIEDETDKWAGNEGTDNT